MEKEGGFAYALLVIIRLLTIVLLCVFIYGAVQGALFVKDLRDTADERMANGEFPLPVGGLVGDLVSAQLQGTIDPQLQPAVEALLEAYTSGDYAEARRQLAQLDAKLAAAGMTDAQRVNQQLMAAIDRGDSAAVQRLSMQLLELLEE